MDDWFQGSEVLYKFPDEYFWQAGNYPNCIKKADNEETHNEGLFLRTFTERLYWRVPTGKDSLNIFLLGISSK